jgi:cobalt/nickel transport protein
MANRNAVLLAAAALLAIVPLFMGFQGEKIFAGADDQAEAAIQEIRPDYEPWFHPLWEPPSGEIESLLFALQAALGAGFLGYYFGLRRGQAYRRSVDNAGHEPR